MKNNIGGNFSVFGGIAFKIVLKGSEQGGFEHGASPADFVVQNICFHKINRVGRNHIGSLCLKKTLGDHAKSVARQTDYLLYACNAAHLVYSFGRWVLVLKLLLSRKKHKPVSRHRLVYGGKRFGSSHVEMKLYRRKNDQTAQGDHGHFGI